MPTIDPHHAGVGDRQRRTAVLQRFGAALCLAAALLGALAGPAEARTRLFCQSSNFAGRAEPCGGNLEPECLSAPACDAGHNRYVGDPFPITIDCPTITQRICVPFTNICQTIVIEDIPNVVVPAGCFDRRPTCADCGAAGQPPCPAVAEPVCGGCDDGFVENAVTGLCERPGTPGQPCGPGVGCADGLRCDLGSLQCVAEPTSGERCFPGVIACADGFQCTLALECATAPRAQEGETCDVSAPCADGLYCRPGIPQRCVARSKPGETCDLLVQPCVAGALCLQGTSGPGLCYPDPTAGAISASRCESFYSPSVAARERNRTNTWFGGGGLVGGVGISRAHGVAYGQDGEYGCFDTLCNGIDIDISIEAFVGPGFYDDYASVAGESFTLVQEGQLPGSPVNVSAAQVFGNAGLSDIIGEEYAIGIGLGASPFPIALGSYGCSTTVNTVYGDIVQVQPPAPGSIPGGVPAAPLPPPVGYGALQFDGIDDRLVIADPGAAAGLAFTDTLTLEFWMRPLAVGGDIQAGQQQDAILVEKAGEYRVALVDGELVFSLANAAPGFGVPVGTGYAPRVNEWVHVALVYGSFDGQLEGRLYVNAQLEGRAPGTGPIGDVLPEDARFALGAGPDGALPFSGQLDSVRLWSAALPVETLFTGLDADRFADAAGLVAGWRFDELAGDLLVDDAAGQRDLERDGLGAAAAPARVVSGRAVLGGALSFDGVDDHVSIEAPADLAALEADGALTLEAWIYPRGPGGNPTAGGLIVSKEGEYSLGRAPDGRLNFALANSAPGWSTVTTNVVVPEFQWSHVALVYDAALGQVRLYLNGELAETRAALGLIGDFHPESPTVRIGGRERDERISTNKQVFEGLIDEVRIWTVARSAAEIAADRDRALDPAAPGLAGYWRFDEGAVALAFDTAAGARHGYLGSGVPWAAPARSEGAALPGYPASLVAPACGGAACPLDTDGDGVSEYTDNCLAVANPDQRDTDFDGYGNRCDADLDGNGAVNFADLALFRQAFGTNDPDADLDGNGAVNFADLALFRQAFGKPPGPSALRP